MSKLKTALVAELVGTFALIFIGAGAGAVGVGGLVGVALAHGLVIVAFAYAYGEISGAHLNPAVTLGLWVAKQVDAGRALAYVAVQIAGGILGAYALAAALGEGAGSLGATVLASGVTPERGLLIEAILTFFLVNTVLNAAVAGRGGSHAGLAIGLTLTFAILAGGPLTGASLNPARTLGPAVATGHYADLWVYLVGPAAGAFVAALLYLTVLKKK